MRMFLRRRVIVPAAVAFVVVAVAVGTAWYLLSGEHRMGSVIGRWLAGRTGLAITVQRASWDGRRLDLRGVRLAPGAELPLDVRVSRLEIDAGIMALMSPAGRTVSVVAASTSITWAPSDSSGVNGIDALRSRLLELLGWPGALRLHSQPVELRTPRGVLTFDLAGEKQGPGLTAALTVVSRGEREPLHLSVRGAAALGRALDLAVDVVGSPRGFRALWPDVTLTGSPVAGRVQLQLVAGGVISSSGRLSLGPSGTSQDSLDFTARYDSASGELSVSRYRLGARRP